MPADYFQGYSNTRRLGLLAPNRFEGVGAVNLIMAHVTAFYNTYRATGEEFFAYPDYFTFQSREPMAAYGQFDIWPDHKSVLVGHDPIDRLNAITDRAINILLVPEGSSTPREFQRQQLAAAASSMPATSTLPAARSLTRIWSSAAKRIPWPAGSRAFSIRFQMERPQQQGG